MTVAGQQCPGLEHKTMCRESGYALMVGLRAGCCEGKRLMRSSDRPMELGFTPPYHLCFDQ